MKKLYTLLFVLLTALSFGQTPIGLIEGLPYTEDFSGMDATTTAFLPGWAAYNVNTGTDLTTMVITNGGATAGNIFNVGATGNDERALGTLADGTVTPAFGAVFQNNSGSIVTKISVRTKMEQWKESGNAGVNEKVAFYYSLNATSLKDQSAIWIAVPALNLNEKLTAATTNLAVNGNSSINYTNPVQTSITLNSNWANGANLWIKWVDNNDAGANGMYAIDDFAIVITNTLGAKQNTIAGLNMYPNPVSKGTLYITSNSNEAKSVSVFDLLGKQVLNTKTTNNAVNVSSLNSGTYIVKITEEGKTDTKKLIIE